MPQCCFAKFQQMALVWPLISAFQCSISLKWDKHTGRGVVITKIEQHSNGVGPWPPIISTPPRQLICIPSLPNETNKGTSDDHQDSNGVTLWPWIISALSLTIHSLPSKWDNHKARSWRWSFCIPCSILCQNNSDSVANNIAFQQLRVGWTQEEGSNTQALSSVTDSVPLSPHSRSPTQRSLMVIT